MGLSLQNWRSTWLDALYCVDCGRADLSRGYLSKLTVHVQQRQRRTDGVVKMRTLVALVWAFWETGDDPAFNSSAIHFPIVGKPPVHEHKPLQHVKL